MSRLIAIIDLFFFYLKEVVLSNFQVAHDVLTPTHHMNPEFVTIPLNPALSNVQIMMLANLITMTPGTLSVEIEEEKHELLIHAMFSEEKSQIIDSIKNNYERRVTRVFS